ncbi:hypothetical protein [Niabella drilacis]|uniref:hypothetical protein n=1 Tax=Niabella drilacis (strain DSM 25811 / CCM 8410 / CCUG 62505 / LMG 26954 / E90) TaxID=1285928 RepID=UPI000B81E28C|nr:hypothetical protein [Niabella drilacis]
MRLLLKDQVFFGLQGLRACLNFIDGIYYEAILERNKENFAGIVGHYGEKFNAVAAQNSHNKAIE